MTWFFIALIAPALYAVCNHIDKFLIEKFLSKDPGQKEEVGSLILFSTLFSLLVLPVIYLIEPGVFSVPIFNIGILLLNGVLCVGAIVLYLYAMEKDEASIVVPFYQLIPVFGYILGVFVLGELLSFRQIVSSLIIIAAAIALSFDLSSEKISFHGRVLWLMSGASFIFALSGVIFKKIAVEQGFWLSAFWEFAGLALMGVIIFLAISTYRRDFIRLLRHSGRPIILLNFLNETLTVIGDLIFMYAYLLAPIALVLVANVFQPFFVFIYGIFLTIFFPRISTEKLSRKHLAQKIAAIFVMMIGAYFLYF